MNYPWSITTHGPIYVAFNRVYGNRLIAVTDDFGTMHEVHDITLIVYMMGQAH